ncbi:MAG: hypothetical protein PHN88_11030 [Ignavibacteria bacterium]|nr:hypothetical protein [Ignavibacteria bacterium]
MDLQSNLDRIKGNESFFEKMKRIIPGYDGYVNKDNSRELDTIIRNKLALKLETNKVKISNTVSNLSSAGRLFETAGVDKIDKKNETAIAKFKSAARGYSGAFDVVKVKEDKLAQLYGFDEALLSSVDNVCGMFDELENASKPGGDIKDVIAKIGTALDELIQKFNDRENILNVL